MMNGDDEIPKVRLGKREFEVPEFKWGEVRKLAPLLRRCSKVNWDELPEDDFQAIGDLIHLVMSRVEPSIQRSDLDDMPGLGINQISAAVPVILRQAGMEAAPKGEAAAG